MNVNDLKLGDWVLIDGEPVKIEEVCPGMEQTYYNDKTHAYKDYTYAEMQPVPLTDEILEKNGWKFNHAIFEGGHHLFMCIVRGKCSVYKVDGKAVWLRDIYYVHELQHILWALGIADKIKL